ncbi:MAG: nucleotidyltransferase domain-containing protein [Deltaproteobacteria bacterium]|nr:nucleotidyltransferase domain-containing protein [Deltaproteobacteria bacterium]
MEGLPGQPDQKLAEIVSRLVKAYRPLHIYLFGSSARGEAGPDSDYDLMMVVPDDASAERKRAKMAYDCLWGTGVAADVVVWTKDRFTRRSSVVTSLPATVIREGKLLYDAQS